MARAYGQAFWSVLSAPYHETLLAYYALEEMERIDQLRADFFAVDQAYAMNAAFHGGHALQRMRRTVMARLNRADREPMPPADELAAQMFALANRLRIH